MAAKPPIASRSAREKPWWTPARSRSAKAAGRRDAGREFGDDAEGFGFAPRKIGPSPIEAGDQTDVRSSSSPDHARDNPVRPECRRRSPAARRTAPRAPGSRASRPCRSARRSRQDDRGSATGNSACSRRYPPPRGPPDRPRRRSFRIRIPLQRVRPDGFVENADRARAMVSGSKPAA